MENIIDDIMTDKLFGFIKTSEEFSEFPPVFKNCEITLADIGEHKQATADRSLER